MRLMGRSTIEVGEAGYGGMERCEGKEERHLNGYDCMNLLHWTRTQL